MRAAVVKLPQFEARHAVTRDADASVGRVPGLIVAGHCAGIVPQRHSNCSRRHSYRGVHVDDSPAVSRD